MKALETGNGFVTPEPPYQFPVSGREDLRSISLPVSDSSPAMMVDMVDGTAMGQDLSLAIMDLAGALKVRRKAWVIIE